MLILGSNEAINQQSVLEWACVEGERWSYLEKSNSVIGQRKRG